MPLENIVDHYRIYSPLTAPDAAPSVENVIIDCPPPYMWVGLSTQQIGEWRANFRSKYIRWAITINGLHKAAEIYSQIDDQNKRFRVLSKRPTQHKGSAAQVMLAEWSMPHAAEVHLSNLPLINAYGVIDLYSCLEDCIFSFYEIYLDENPESLLKGQEYRELRTLRRSADKSTEGKHAWLSAWQSRKISWRRKRLYDGLHEVFKAYITLSARY